MNYTTVIHFDVFKFSSTPSYVASGTFSSWGTLFPAIVQFALVCAVILFIILMVVGGIQYLASAGNEEGTKLARKLLLNATVGLFIMLSVQAAAAWVLIRTNKTDLLQYIPRYSYGSFGWTGTPVTSAGSNSSSVTKNTGNKVPVTTDTGDKVPVTTAAPANCTKSPASADVQCISGPDNIVTSPTQG